MTEELKRVLDKLNVDYAEIHLEEREASGIYYAGKEVETVQKNTYYVGNVRVFHRGGWGLVTFNDPSKIEKYARQAVKMAKLVSTGKGGLKLGKPIKKKVKVKLDDDPRKISFEEKRDLVKHYNDMLLKNKKIINTRTGYSESFMRRWILTTEGTDIMEERLYSGLSFAAYAMDGPNVQVAFDSVGEQKGWNLVLNLEKKVENIAKDAIDLLKAEKVKGGIYTVILDPKLAGTFIHEAFGHLSEADHIYENERIRSIMKIGKRFGPDNLSVIDDGTMYGLRGSLHYDDEGTTTHKTHLIKNGILTGRLHSKETAYKMGEEPTGNARAIDYSFPPIVRMTCTYIEKGNKSFEEIIGDIDHGIYAVAALGGQTELEMFTFSSMKAYIIEKGKIKNMIRDVILSGNVFETLKNIDAIGNDLTMFGGLGGCGKDGQFPLPVSDGAPHIRIKNVVIGGKK